jgi:hypothetical protein
LKRIAIALALSGVVFGTVYALAATLNVGFGTAATGTGDVGSCGDVTGSTYILESQSIGFAGDDIVGSLGNLGPADITEFKAVNIESVPDCDQINVFVAVYDGEGGTGNVIATGSCQISGDSDGVVDPGDPPEDDGLGYDELGTGDNVPGCTAVVGTDTVLDDDLPDVADAESIVVTMT